MLAEEGAVEEIVAASAGNHAQGVALAASLCDLRSTVFMPAGASLPKVEATRNYGANVHFVPGNVDDAIKAAREYASSGRAFYVPPFDDELVIAGQGTIGLELADEVPGAGTVLVPVGGGGLSRGLRQACAGRGSRARIIGVEAVGAAPMLRGPERRAPGRARFGGNDGRRDRRALRVPTDLRTRERPGRRNRHRRRGTDQPCRGPAARAVQVGSGAGGGCTCLPHFSLGSCQAMTRWRSSSLAATWTLSC